MWGVFLSIGLVGRVTHIAHILLQLRRADETVDNKNLLARPVRTQYTVFAMSPFAYVTLTMVAVWAVTLVLSERTRMEQAVMSVLGALITPTALSLVGADARAAGTGALAAGAAEFAFAAASFGIAAVLCHVVLHARTAAWRGPRLRIRPVSLHWVAHLAIVAGTWLFIAIAAQIVLSVAPFPAMVLSGVMVGLYALADRKDLMLDALLTGASLAALVFLIEQTFFARMFPTAASGFWAAGNLSGILLAGVPIEEIVWAAVVGFTAGPLYEYVRHRRLS